MLSNVRIKHKGRVAIIYWMVIEYVYLLVFESMVNQFIYFRPLHFISIDRVCVTHFILVTGAFGKPMTILGRHIQHISKLFQHM